MQKNKKSSHVHTFSFIAIPSREKILQILNGNEDLLPNKENIKNYSEHFPVIIPYYISKHQNYSKEEIYLLKNNINKYAKEVGAKVVDIEKLFLEDINHSQVPENQIKIAKRIFDFIKAIDSSKLEPKYKIPHIVDLVKLYLPLTPNYIASDFNNILLDVDKYKSFLEKQSEAGAYMRFSESPSNYGMPIIENKFTLYNNQEKYLTFVEKILDNLEDALKKEGNDMVYFNESTNRVFAEISEARNFFSMQEIGYYPNLLKGQNGVESSFGEESYLSKDVAPSKPNSETESRISLPPEEGERWKLNEVSFVGVSGGRNK